MNNDDSPEFSGRATLSGGRTRRGSAGAGLAGGRPEAAAGAANQQSERIELTYRRLVVRTPFTRQTRITVVAETRLDPTPDRKSSVQL